MFHWSMGAAGLVAIAAIGVVDYKQKAEASGATISTFSVSGYMDALGRQSDAAQAKRAEKDAVAELTTRQSAGTLMYLPQAPEGWTRRAWSEGDNSAIAPPAREITTDEQEIRAAISSSPMAGLLATDEKIDKSNDKHSWVYARDADLVAVSAKLLQPARTDTVSGMAMSMLSANMGGFVQQNGFAVVQGVAFVENGADILSEKKATYRSFEAFIGMGQEVHLRVRTALDTPDDAIFEILNAIDYVGLNALLAQPLAGVGPHAPDLDPDSQVALAELAFDIRKKIKSRETSEISEKMRNLDPMSIAIKQFSTGGAATETAHDVNAKALEDQRKLDKILKDAHSKQAAMADDAKPEETAKAETAGGWGSKIADLAKSAGFGGGKDTAPDAAQQAASNDDVTTFTCTIEGGRKRCIADK